MKASILTIRWLYLALIVTAAFLMYLYLSGRKCPVSAKQKEENREEQKRSIILFLGILSKLSALKRRDGIRETWMTKCLANSFAVCRFFTDKRKNKSSSLDQREEDHIIHMPYSGGYNFALRLIWMMKWATDRYNFEYFLRIDDDHYLCFDRLMYELPSRPKVGLYWGFIHCKKDVVRVDEGWLLLSSDLVAEALGKLSKTLLCHPYGDQAVALWIADSQYNVTYFYDNDRIVHTATSFHPSKYLKKDICDRYLSLHGTYPTAMLQYWILDTHLRNLRRVESARHYERSDIKPFQELCSYGKRFDVNAFWPTFRFQPKLCKDNPRWEGMDKEVLSREEIGGALA